VVGWLRRELSQEEKSLALLGRIDFGQEFKKIKKEEDGSKKEEKEIVQQWPWQGLVDHLQQAHQELAIILDMINHVRFLQTLCNLCAFICSGFCAKT
jgi:mediator of RNA polymerase II transcription subunit 17